MSKVGIRAARWVGRVQPMRGRQVAAELRNAVTAASLAADQLDDQDLAEDVAESVRLVCALAEALTLASMHGEVQEAGRRVDAIKADLDNGRATLDEIEARLGGEVRRG